MHIPQGHECIFTIYFFIYKKTKESSNPKLKILCQEIQYIYIYYSPKNLNGLCCSQSFFQCQMYPMKKTISLLIACLTSFFGKENYVIILLQSIIIFVYVNSKRVNNNTLIHFSFFVIMKIKSKLNQESNFYTNKKRQ